MTIPSTHTDHPGTPPIGAMPPVGGARRGRHDALREVTNQTRLSTLAPHIEAALRDLTGPGGTLVEILSSNVETLQEEFIEALYMTLAEEQIHLGDKVTLRLGSNGSLIVCGDHPEKERLSTTLERHPALSAAFAEIASQSEILRDIGNIGKVMSRQTGEPSLFSDSAASAFAVYQMSLKGEMSHFYFSRV